MCRCRGQASGWEVFDGSPQPFRDPAYSAAAATYLRPDGSIPELGDIVKQTELAGTLRTLASKGADAFYRGEIAEKLVSHIQEVGGLLTAEDFAEYEPRWMAPIETTYRDFRITGIVRVNHLWHQGFPLLLADPQRM